MSDQDKITAILASIQTDANLLILMKLIVANNIGNASTTQLNMICQVLGIQIN